LTSPTTITGEVLDAVGHELEPEHEDAEPPDDGHQNVFEVVDLHEAPVVA
jgi:hypothetical protein